MKRLVRENKDKKQNNLRLHLTSNTSYCTANSQLPLFKSRVITLPWKQSILVNLFWSPSDFDKNQWSISWNSSLEHDWLLLETRSASSCI